MKLKGSKALGIYKNTTKIGLLDGLPIGGYPMSQFISFASAQSNPQVSGVLDITPEELQSKKNQVLLVDVRRPDEYEGELGHIPGAQLMVLDTLPDRLSELPKDQTVVFICRSGGRSAQATAYAQSQGFQSVFNMQGGMLRWNELQFETES